MNDDPDKDIGLDSTMSFSIKDFQDDRILKRKNNELRKRGPIETARDRALS